MARVARVPPTKAAVVTEGLTRRFGAFTAVDHVSFDVGQGEIFGFLGPTGKTTTIRMLAGLLAPTEGRGTVAGFDIETGADQIKSRIGYMSQLFSLYADLTVDENIRFFAGLYGVHGARLVERRDWLLEMSGLAAARARITGELPLGWKQRLALGCAMLHEPPVLFLDEPTSGVDPGSRREFWSLIAGLAERGTTVFVSTHYMEEAEYCHRLALMNRGRLIALDRPAALRARMPEAIVEVRTNRPADVAQLLRGLPHVVDAAMFGRWVHALVPDADEAITTIPGFLAPHGIHVDGIGQVPPSLEDVFVSLVRSEGGAVAG
jgi:ABC-2 type transport system ATP-binding protein